MCWTSAGAVGRTPPAGTGAPWRVTDPGGALELTLLPRFDKHCRTDAGLLRTEVHQVFGTWSGTVVGEDGSAHRLEAAQGFAEESRNRW